MDLEQLHDNDINVKSRIIYLGQKDLDDDPIGYNSSTTLIKNLDYLNDINKKPIIVKGINLTGGDVGHGLAMYGALKNSKSKVNIECYGFTASFGSILLQAASNGGRAISQYSDFMIHFGNISFDGDMLSAESAASSNKLWRSKMLNIYSERCVFGDFFSSRKYSLSRVKGYLNTKVRNSSDWYMTPEECLDYGFVDHII
jgi:ATP-dependent protease ClpP protease subunit